MTTELAVIVDAAERWYVASVVNGTVERYYPKPWARLRRPTAQWARRAGERWVRRYRRWESRRERRAARARRVTRPTEQEGDRAVGSAS